MEQFTTYGCRSGCGVDGIWDGCIEWMSQCYVMVVAEMSAYHDPDIASW